MADVEPASAGADAARKAAATETAAATDAKSSQLQQQPADAVAKELADTAAEASATGEAAAAAAGDVPHLTFKVRPRRAHKPWTTCGPHARTHPEPQLADASHAAAAAAAPSVPMPSLMQVQYGKQSQELKRPATSTIADLKAEVRLVDPTRACS
jgi:hypothetical protein